jgi:hypothetical protein
MRAFEMCCYILLGIFGLIIVIKGQVMLTYTKEVRGIPARLIGILLLLPLPLELLAGLLLGTFYVAQGRTINRSDIQGISAILGVVIIAFCVLSAIAIAAVYAQPISKRRRKGDADPVNLPDHYGEHFQALEGRRPASNSDNITRTDEPPSVAPPDDRIQG